MSVVLCIDPGIFNLSIAIASCDNTDDFTTYKIHLWDVYDTLEEDNHLCDGVTKKGQVCGKTPSFWYKNDDKYKKYTCKTHCPKEIQKFVYKKKVAKDYLLQEKALAVINKIQQLYDDNIELFNSITLIALELQPTVNPSVKMLSHVIFGKFVDLYKDLPSVQIRFIPASRKLKVGYKGPEVICKLKSAYSRRKYLSVQYTKWYLENEFCNEQRDLWLPHLLSRKIQFDMSDALLMCINALHGVPRKKITRL